MLLGEALRVTSLKAAKVLLEFAIKPSDSPSGKLHHTVPNEALHVFLKT